MFLVSLALASAPAPVVTGDLQRVVRSAATTHRVPAPLLFAIGWEASHLNPDSNSEYGGYGMFGLREGTAAPNLEAASALIEANPNHVMADWQLSVQASAALLADAARLSNGGVLPAATDLDAWWDAVRAFSDAHNPEVQDRYAAYIFAILADGLETRTRWGPIRVEPQSVAIESHFAFAPPPPGSTDSSLADDYVEACYYTNGHDGSDVDMIVIHTMQGSYSGAISWFANCGAEASAHYMVNSEDGEITQMVRESNTAWHAGHWDTNTRSIGIEHEGYIDDTSWMTDVMYRESAALSADIATRQGIPIDRDHIIGHIEVPGCAYSGGGSGCHTDPGDYFDWDYYMALVAAGGNLSTGEIIGVVADSDITNGTRLAGARVWIAETMQETTADGSGVYRFADVPFGPYTMHAIADGYAEGTCSKTTSGAQDWCSIALFPDAGGTDNGVTDTAPVDTPPTDGGTGTNTDGADDTPTPKPGNLVPVEGIGGCASAPGGSLVGFLAGTALILRRRLGRRAG